MSALHAIDDPIGTRETGPQNGIMASTRHPEAQRRLERRVSILRHLIRIRKQIQAQRIPTRPVVVVVRDLKGPTAVVTLSCCTGVLRIRCAVITWRVDLADVLQPAGLLLHVSEEGCDLPFLIVATAGGSERGVS